jgi:hypothetical protein
MPDGPAAELGNVTTPSKGYTPPEYYRGDGGMQPFDVIDAFGLDFYEGNIIKYVCRWRKKNGIEDLYKARTYLNKLIERIDKADQAEADVFMCRAPSICVNGPRRHAANPSCRWQNR